IDPFSRELAEAVVAQHEQLDVRITTAADEWTADRLGALERNILRMAIVELDRGEVPPEVAIDEAVTLAKRYSTGSSARARSWRRRRTRTRRSRSSPSWRRSPRRSRRSSSRPSGRRSRDLSRRAARDRRVVPGRAGADAGARRARGVDAPRAGG